MEALYVLLVLGLLIFILGGCLSGFIANARALRLEKRLLELQVWLQSGGAGRMPGTPDEAPPDDPQSRQWLRSLSHELWLLKQRLTQLESALYIRRSAVAPPSMERMEAPVEPEPAGPASVAVVPPSVPEAPPPQEQPAPATDATWYAAQQDASTRAGAPASSAGQTFDREWWNRVESIIGKRWLTWAGALIIVASTSFFLKFAFEQGWLGAEARAAIILAVGLALIYSGVRCLRSGMSALGHGLAGAGLAVLYVAIYTALAVYHVMGMPLALGLLVVVTAGGVALALAHDAMAIGVLATIGGYLAPLLAMPLGDARDVLFSYILLLNLGVLAVALFRRWLLLDGLVLLGTVWIYSVWMERYFTPEQYGPAMAWLAVFFLVFMLLPFLYHLRTLAPAPLLRFALSITTALLTVSAANWVLQPAHPELLGLTALLMCVCYLAMAVAFKLRLPLDVRAHNGFLALAISLGTYAFSLLFSLNATTLAWAIEAPLLAYLGFSFSSPLTRRFSIAVLCLVLLRIVICNFPLHDEMFRLVLNPAFGTLLSLPLAAGVTALLHHLFRRGAEQTDVLLARCLAIGAGLVALGLAHVEIAEWFEWRGGGSTLVSYMSLSSAYLLWTLGAALFLAWGLWWDAYAARVTGLLISAGLFICGVGIYLYQMPEDLKSEISLLPFANYRFSVLLLATVVLFTYSWSHTQRLDRMPAGEQNVPTVLSILTGLGLIWLVHAESGLAVYWHAAPAQYNALSALCLESLVWVLGAACYLAAGVLWRSHAARLSGVVPLFAAGVLVAAAYGQGSHSEVGMGQPLLLVLNERFVCGMVVVGLTFAWAYCLRAWLRFSADEAGLGAWLYGSADLLLLALFSFEAFSFYSSVNVPGISAAELASVSLSIVWSIYALCFLVAGFILRNRPVRISALGLFGITTLKLLFVDFSYLDPGYRLLSSVFLGVLMIAASYMYHRIARLIEPLEAGGASVAVVHT